MHYCKVGWVLNTLICNNIINNLIIKSILIRRIQFTTNKNKMTELIKFDDWNKQKKIIHVKELEEFYIKPREIWFVKLGINIWFEENWKKEFRRPVLVIKKVWNLYFTVAMTTKWKSNNKFYHKLNSVVFNERNQKHKDESYIILSQVKVIDKKRFTENIGDLPESEFFEIKEKLKVLLL